MTNYQYKFPLDGRYLISGAAGFIGSHLSERLIELGAKVIGVDNFITGRPENLKNLLKHSRFEFIEQDVIHPLEIEGGLAGVFHMASPASPVDYLKFPIETLRVGALGADRMCQLAEQKNCPILVASTSEVYGDPQVHPQREDYWGHVNPVGPRGCYDESKRYQEALVMAYKRTKGVKTRIIRIFNTYGPRMRTNDGRVVPNFCVQALKGEPITVYGDGKQTRSFCYVDDLLEGILRAFDTDLPGPVNLGNPTEMTILQFAERIQKLSGTSSAIVHKELPEDDPKIRRPDISRAKELLNWEPRVPLDEGLKRSLEYFRENL